MSDRPWLEDADPALRSERELLKRLNAEQPPPNVIDQGWAALAAEIAVIPPTAPDMSGTVHVAPQAASTAAGVGVAAKIVVGVAIAGGALWGGSELLKSEPPSVMQRPQHTVTVEALPRVVDAQPAPVAPPAEAAVSAQEPSVQRRAASATSLAEEGRLLAKAHQLVQSGQSQRALEVLRASQTRYPRSVLSQEREVLTIEALYASGATGAAKQRAEQFLKRNPTSPHAGRLQRFVE